MLRNRLLNILLMLALVFSLGLVVTGSSIAQDRVEEAETEEAETEEELTEEGEEPTSQPTQESIDPRGSRSSTEEVQPERNEGNEDDNGEVQGGN